MFSPFRFAIASQLPGKLESAVPGGDARAHREPTPILVSIAILAALVSICVIAIAPALWSVVTELARTREPTLQECSAIKAEPARVACYDAYAARNRTHPAKGGEAPLLKPGS
jgi:hypothetical protein